MKSIHSAVRPTIHNAPTATYGAHLYAVPAAPRRRATYVPAGRSVHLIDIENLMGGPHHPLTILHEAMGTYVEVAGVRVGDHVIVGANHRLGAEIKFAYPSVRLVVRGGADGADLALCEALADERWIAERFDRIVIGSGDGIFVDAVARFRNLGLPVGVVAAECRTSRALRQRSSYFRAMPEFTMSVQAVSR
jgi:hypothetical protein